MHAAHPRVGDTARLARSSALAILLTAFFGEAPARAETQNLARTLAAAKSWGYQLQGVDPDVIAKSPYDMVVIDYSRDGTDAEALTPADLEKLKRKPDGGRRIVLSYLSIGEAEKYRYYWKWYWGWLFGWFAPAWRDRQNTEWRGNYAVRYWEPSWQDIIFAGDNSYLDRIIKAGFDGVWLDKVDEFEFFEKKSDAPALMIAFVSKLAAHARARKAGFLIVPQNGEALLSDAAYRGVIDGIGKEDILFGETKDDKPNKPSINCCDCRQAEAPHCRGQTGVRGRIPRFAAGDRERAQAAARLRLHPPFCRPRPRQHAHRRRARSRSQARGRSSPAGAPGREDWTSLQRNVIKPRRFCGNDRR